MKGRGEEGEMNGGKGRGYNRIMHLVIPTLSESLKIQYSPTFKQSAVH